MLKLLGDLIESVVAPAPGLAGFGRQSELDDRHVVDAAPDDLRLRNALRQLVDVAADLVVNAQHCEILAGSNQKARRHHHAVVKRLRIDVFDTICALDDVLERPGHEFDGVIRLVAIGGDENIHHRHADLRFLFAR